jgi:hypothetical protein
MIFKEQVLSIEEVRQRDLVDYLYSLGYEPVKIRRDDYWYLSPLRDEKTASFKVNRKLNVWYDHGLGKGGNLIDFAILYNNCTVAEFLKSLDSNLSFHQPSLPQVHQEQKHFESELKVLKERPLHTFSLYRYLHQRRIPYDLARQHCNEVTYELKGKEYYAIGFKNNSGGYELRNPYIKLSSSPKDITTIDNGAKEVAVFEGFIDFLSFRSLQNKEQYTTQNYVILNSVSFFEKARLFMEQHKRIQLYLDRDTTGQKCSLRALSINKKYKDESGLYKHYKDLNDWMMNIGKKKKNLSKKGRRQC